MSPSEIVIQLKAILPRYTDFFTDNIANTAIVVSSGTATATTPTAHGLSTGAAVIIADAVTPNPIASFTKDGLNFTFTTTEAHDLTLGEQDTVTLSGFTDGDWNATFDLKAVPNRNEFTVQSIAADPILNTNEILNEILITGINGIFGITVTAPTTFTFATTSRDTTSTVVIKSNPKITAVPDIDELTRQYTAQTDVNDFWAFVVFNPVTASKDRSIKSDRVNSKTAADDPRANYSQSFSVFVVAPTPDQFSALAAMDACYQQLLLPFTKSLVGFKPISPLSETSVYTLTLIGSSNAGYNRAYYIHQYDFEFAFDLTQADVVEPISNQAYRDATTGLVAGTDTPLTANIDLDEEP